MPCGARVRHRRLRPLPAQQAMLATGKDARRGCCLVKGLISCIPLRSFPPPTPKKRRKVEGINFFLSLFFFKARLHSPAKTAHLNNYSYLKCPRYFFVQSIFYRSGQLLMKFNPSYQEFPPHSYNIFSLPYTHPCNTKFATNLLWH